MNPIIKEIFEKEMRIAKELYLSKKWEEAFSHLEKAHILGQRNAIPHTINHWWMLKVGIRKKDGKEIRGQIIRLLVVGIGSLLGRAPIGNTGGSNVGIMTPLPISSDIAQIFIKANLPIR
ncbi:DUF3703 domain-containing protein [Leptospira bourretii]|uniref:DUF3703 domain-containing protein n=2 Tax=Leptospira TaxID=171 RepID=A0A4R9IKW1_9LEPT|nr:MULTISPECIES: DUF3703 domain-containing protein [Leptospira]MCW7467568.1 DUF3703 domain-containing protein [Leptospira levettii]MCW7513490.1 DUF3703 domain-containing protein [Leptospira levettii]MCW7517234.1 DUF3703 domain-containing protein [Leptospira levettii]TGK84829.1 DUF3703 domain-containing protein [Leptospira bourretii]TGK90596.1 DUF3703 domain-containing protein [Leptospira bourretii]